MDGSLLEALLLLGSMWDGLLLEGLLLIEEILDGSSVEGLLLLSGPSMFSGYLVDGLTVFDFGPSTFWGPDCCGFCWPPGPEPALELELGLGSAGSADGVAGFGGSL